MANETTGGAMRLTAEQARQKTGELKGYCVKRLPDSELFALHLPATVGQSGDRLWGPFGTEEAAWQCKYLPNWPADIATAWLLLEEMEESFYGLYRSEEGWQINYFDRDVPTPSLRETKWQSTAPFAICAAWLSRKLDRPVEIVDETEASECLE